MNHRSPSSALTERACAAHQAGEPRKAAHLIDAAVAVVKAEGDLEALARVGALREVIVRSPSPPGPVWSVVWSTVKDGAPPDGVVAAAAQDPGGAVSLQAAFATAPGLRRIFEPLLREVTASESQRAAPLDDNTASARTAVTITLFVVLFLARLGSLQVDRNHAVAQRRAAEGAAASTALRAVSPPAVGERIDPICLKAPAVCLRVADALKSSSCKRAWAEVEDAPADYHRELFPVLEASCPKKP